MEAAAVFQRLFDVCPSGFVRHSRPGLEAEAISVAAAGCEAGNMDCCILLSNLHVERDEVELAEAAYRRSISLGDYNSYYNLALMLDEVGRTEEATELMLLGAQEGDEWAVAWLDEQRQENEARPWRLWRQRYASRNRAPRRRRPGEEPRPRRHR